MWIAVRFPLLPLEIFLRGSPTPEPFAVAERHAIFACGDEAARPRRRRRRWRAAPRRRKAQAWASRAGRSRAAGGESVRRSTWLYFRWAAGGIGGSTMGEVRGAPRRFTSDSARPPPAV